MKRRSFIAGLAGAGTVAAGGLPAPALAQKRLEWRLTMAWPKNFPGLGTAAVLLADYIGRASDGRFTLRVHGAGEVAPGRQAIDAVAEGSVEIGHGASHLWADRLPAAGFIAGLPFGLTAQEQNAWLAHGGGQALADKSYDRLGCKFLAGGNTGAQMGGWFTREIDTREDLHGLAISLPGLGAAVLAELGALPVDLPGAEIATKLADGTLDAAAWFGPYADLALGLQDRARLYYAPGWHAPAMQLDFFINRAAWDALPADLKAMVEAAAAAANAAVLNEFTAKNAHALDALVTQHGTILKRFPNALLNQLGALAGQVVNDKASADPLSREILDSILTFRQRAIPWAGRAEQAALAARALPFAYAKVGGG